MIEGSGQPEKSVPPSVEPVEPPQPTSPKPKAPPLADEYHLGSDGIPRIPRADEVPHE